MKKPQSLVLFPWWVYEVTTNDPNGQYNQSSLAILVDMPIERVLDGFGSIPIWVAPPGTQYIDFLNEDDENPTKAQLVEWNWKEVLVGTAQKINGTAGDGYQGKRKQYCLKYARACTIDKSQGQTIPMGIAVKISSKDTCLWEKE